MPAFAFVLKQPTSFSFTRDHSNSDGVGMGRLSGDKLITPRC